MSQVDTKKRTSGDLPPTEFFGRYRILGLLGQGGMARVHIAEQPGIDGFSKIVALKRVHQHLADNVDLRRMFTTEAKVAARLDHPNIVAVHELGEVDGTYFMSMEYLPGEDLAAVFERTGNTKPMPVELALWIGENAAAALHHAHELTDPQGRLAGVVHRDVTPSNIMLTYHGVVKLLDFGIAKSRTSDVSTREGVFKGKLAYSAPEQLTGGDIDRRVDIFCLGIVLWECLTGRGLFHGATDAERLDAVRGREIVRPSSIRPEVPAELDALVLRMLARDRNARCATALEVQQVLGDLLGWQLDRVTPETASAWLESTFATERAAAKRAIAQGQNVGAMMQTLARMQAEAPAITTQPPITRGSSRPRPRKAWSTGEAGGASTKSTVSNSTPQSIFTDIASDPHDSNPGVFDAPSTPLRKNDVATGEISVGRRSSAPLVALLALVVIAVIAGAISFAERDPSPTAGNAIVGAIEVMSDPPGAHIFVDEAPTGLVTPATIHRLPLGRRIVVGVKRADLLSSQREMTLTGPDTQKLQFALGPASGQVKALRVPPRTRVFLDNQLVDATGPLELSLGHHALRVESADDVQTSTAPPRR